MSTEEYLASIGLGHLRPSAAGAVPLAYRIELVVEPAVDGASGGVFLSCDVDSYDGDTPKAAAAHLEHLARETEAEAARYRAALAVLRGEAPQPAEVKP